VNGARDNSSQPVWPEYKRIQLCGALKLTGWALCAGLCGKIRLIGGALLTGGRGGNASLGVPAFS
jgi:hypothetical protein